MIARPNIFSSKPWIRTGIATSVTVKNNLYEKFSREKNSQKKTKYQTNSGSIVTIFPLFSYYKRFLEENKKNVKTNSTKIKELISTGPKNELCLTTL